MKAVAAAKKLAIKEAKGEKAVRTTKEEYEEASYCGATIPEGP